jgi:hypothetical protein
VVFPERFGTIRFSGNSRVLSHQHRGGGHRGSGSVTICVHRFHALRSEESWCSRPDSGVLGA